MFPKMVHAPLGIAMGFRDQMILVRRSGRVDTFIHHEYWEVDPDADTVR